MINNKCVFGLLAILIGCLIVRCTTREGWTLHGSTSFTAYGSALLVDEEGNRLDSVPVRDGEFSMTIAAPVANPSVMTVRLVNLQNPSDSYNMPVVVENAVVDLKIEDYLSIGGTRLNDDLQQFLDALQVCHDRCLRQPGMTAEEVERTFSDFYLQQITLHHNDVLGGYIYRNYGVHLDAPATRSAKKLLNIK